LIKKIQETTLNKSKVNSIHIENYG